MAWRGMARLGEAWQGEAWQGFSFAYMETVGGAATSDVKSPHRGRAIMPARAILAWPGEAWPGEARLGRAGQGLAWRGMARLGRARQGEARHGKARVFVSTLHGLLPVGELSKEQAQFLWDNGILFQRIG